LKRLITSMTFIIALFLLSCSWATSFYVVNKSGMPITEITLAPGELIKVAEICCSYTGPEKIFADKLNVEELNINTPDGLLKYESFELLKIFKKKDKTKYVLEYS